MLISEDGMYLCDAEIETIARKDSPVSRGCHLWL